MSSETSLGMSMEMVQKQVLSPQLIQSARILQMNAQELSDYLKEQALENPVIDIQENPAAKDGDDRIQKYEWLNSFRDRGYVSLADKDPDDEDSRDAFNFDVSRGESLEEYLHAQLITGDFTDREQEILRFMIGSLNSAGYFVENTDFIAKRFGVPETEILAMLKVIQGLDPAGVGARSLKECLTIQAERNGLLTDEIRRVIENHLEDIAGNRLPAIGKSLGISLEEVKKACSVIRRLNPKPGNSFSDRQQLRYITPDVLIVRFPDHTDILLNDSLYPGVGINSYYSSLFRESDDPEVRGYLENKIRQAEWIKNSIARRDETLLRIARQIYLEQKKFFTVPGAPLVPLRLSDVAEALDIHESTVSRAVRGKYLQCSRGVYPLHYFFPSGAASGHAPGTAPEGPSSDAVKQKIRAIIGGEDRKKPLSDQKICDRLAAGGICVSRRVIAKYREEMGIPAASRRKEY